MRLPKAFPLRRALLSLNLLAFGAAALACGVLPFTTSPARGYVYGSGAPLIVAIDDQTGGDDWAPAVAEALDRYATATANLRFQRDADGAHISVTLRRYEDSTPPEIAGYAFQPGVGGFAAVYDAAGIACNFPPSSTPLACSGEIARAEIYVNDSIPAGDDIETRRVRLVLHELGHAMGLTRHSPELDIDDLARRYGWR